MFVDQHTHLELLMAAVIGILGAARVVRLLVADSFPPIVKARIWYQDHVPSSWGSLSGCPWCMAPYVVGADLAWALASNLGIGWYIVNGWLAASYVASWIVYKDED